MSKNLYITTMEPGGGKSVVALGIMELLSRRLHKIGFFRPIIPNVERDNNIQLILSRYNLKLSYEQMYAYRHDDAQHMTAVGKYDALLKNILDKYKALESQSDFVLCEGTDYTGVSSAFEFDFNAEVANNMGCPILVVLNGRTKSPREIIEAIEFARESFENRGCTILAMIVNRIAPPSLDLINTHLRQSAVAGVPVYALPEVPLLGKPSVGEIAAALDGRILQGEPDRMHREVSDIKIAAMSLPHFLEYITDGTLVITPGDRHDIILGSLAAAASETYPNISGLLLTGGLTPEPSVAKLMEGFRKSAAVPILSVDGDTYSTALHAGSVRAALTPQNDR
ncbi:MAG: AAA family ATPase, partial [Desulfobacterales bacterium]